MSKEIRAGDLVMVVKAAPCCGAHGKLTGLVFTVESLGVADFECDCSPGKLTEAPYAAFKRAGKRKLRYVELSRLIRIDPPALPESVETEREVAV